MNALSNTDRLPRFVRWFALVVVVLGAFLVYSRATDHGRLLQAGLNIPALPQSVRSVHCTSASTTDVLTDCDFELDSSDLPALLVGRVYAHEADTSTERHATGYADTAPFVVAHVYRARTEGSTEFLHGGHFFVFLNATRTKARSSLYIE